MMSIAKMILGRVYMTRGKFESARPLLVDAVVQASHGRNMELVGFCRTLLARILDHLGETEEAYREATAAVDITVPFPPVHAAVLAALARLFLRHGRLEEALRASTGAFEIAGVLGTIELDDAFVRLTHAEVLRACGAHDTALAVIAAARTRLLSEAEWIVSPDLRRSVLEDVPEHVRIFELAESWGLPWNLARFSNRHARRRPSGVVATLTS